MMTFKDIAERWDALTKDPGTGRPYVDSEELRWLLRTLCAPDGLADDDHRGWFTACWAWVHGGPPPDDYQEIQEVQSALPESAQSVAEAHLACAKAAIQAQTLALLDPQAPLRLRTEVPGGAQPLIKAACEAITQLERAWTDTKPFATQLTILELAKEVLNVHWLSPSVSAADLVVQTFRLLIPSLKTPLPNVWATARDLTLELLEATRRPTRTETLTGILVQRDQGVVADVQLDLIPDGAGCFYPSPALAFVRRDADFLQAEADARTCVQEHYGLWAPMWDVRWSLRRRDGQLLPLDFLQETDLEGDSLGAAWALGIAKLAVET